MRSGCGDGLGLLHRADTRRSASCRPSIGTPMSTDVHYPAGKPAKESEMLYWALVFLLIAIVAGAIGFGGVAVAFAGLAKIVFFIFLVLLVVSLVAHVRA